MNSSLDCFIRLPIIYLNNDYSPKHIPSNIFGQLTQKPSIKFFFIHFPWDCEASSNQIDRKKCTKMQNNVGKYWERQYISRIC